MRDLLTKLRDERGDITIYSGGALGIDQFWMQVGQFLQIPVVAILPFPGFDKMWPEDSSLFLQGMLDNCLEVRYTHSEAVGSANPVKSLLDRNQDLVNACDTMVAYWNGSKSGTEHAVKLTRQAGKKILIFNPDEIT